MINNNSNPIPVEDHGCATTRHSIKAASARYIEYNNIFQN